MDQGRSKLALDGIKERWIREQAMDQRATEWAILQAEKSR